MLMEINPNISDIQMKRLVFILPLLFSFLLLSACADKGITDNFKAYRGMSAKKILEQAERKLATKDYDAATTHLSALDAIFPFGVYAEQGLVDSIYAYYMDQQPDMALVSADRYLRLYPRGAHVDYALYMKGIIQYNQNLSWLQKKVRIDPASMDVDSNQSAFGAFYALVKDYPRSSYSADALARMKYLRDLFARHELIVGQYYYDRHAYVAAVNRASGVVVHFNGTSSTRPALKLLVASYKQLGLTELQANTQRLLDASTVSSS